MNEVERAFPAFPYPPEQTRLTLQLGMTLRDAFALAALPSAYQISNTSGERAYVARLAYELADAMLAERDKT